MKLKQKIVKDNYFFFFRLMSSTLFMLLKLLIPFD